MSAAKQPDNPVFVAPFNHYRVVGLWSGQKLYFKYDDYQALSEALEIAASLNLWMLVVVVDDAPQYFVYDNFGHEVLDTR